MEKNSTKKIIAIAALLLLTIGAGYLIEHRNTSDNSRSHAANASMTPGAAAITTPEPVATPPVADGTVAPGVTTGTDDAQAPGNAKVAARSVRRRHVQEKRGHTNKIATADNNVDYATAAVFEGNMPASVNDVNSTAPTAPASEIVPSKQLVVHAAAPKINAGRGYRKPGGANLGLEAGPGINGFYHNSTNNELTNGLHAGLLLNIALGDALALQPGMMYAMKGNEDKRTDESEGMQVNTTHAYTLNYLEVPVNVVFKFGDVKGAPRFMIGGGPYISYLISVKDKVEIDNLNAEGFSVYKQDYSTNSVSNINRFDFGLGGFAGCQLPGGFYAKVGTEWGFTDVQMKTGSTPSSDRNYNYSISLGYIIGPKNKVY